MRRRSRTGGEPVKTRRRKTAAQKRGNAPKVRDQDTEIARVIRERDQALEQLSEALEQQTATSEVLRVISASPGELEPVFDAMLANATRICEAKFGNLFLHDHGTFRTVAMHNAPPAYAAARMQGTIRPPPDTALGQLARTKQVVQIADVSVEPGYI